MQPASQQKKEFDPSSQLVYLMVMDSYNLH